MGVEAERTQTFRESIRMRTVSEKLQEDLVDETILECGHEERVGQLSMSSLYLPLEEILDRIRNGCAQTRENKLKLYQGKHAERGMRERLRALALRRGLLFEEPRVLNALDGRLTGHTDCGIGGAVVEIKTVPDADVLSKMRARAVVPYRVRCQVNAYMKWGPYPKALVVYETRCEGLIWVTELLPDLFLQSDLEKKALTVLGKI